MKPKVLETWHACVAKNDLGDFEAIVADDAVFVSPALHAPQVGKAMVSMYLRGALLVLNNGTFRYVEEWVGHRARRHNGIAKGNGRDENGVDAIH